MGIPFQGNNVIALEILCDAFGLAAPSKGNLRVAIDAAAAEGGVTPTINGNNRDRMDELWDLLNSIPVLAYPLDDDGTNAAIFEASLLPTIAPARLRALYECTGSAGELIASPASLTAEPGSVLLLSGAPRVCGFKINSVITVGAGQSFRFYVTNGDFYGNHFAISVSVNTDVDGLTCTITPKAAYIDTETDFGTPYSGATADVKIAIQLNNSSGTVSGKVFVNGSLIGTSAGYSVDPRAAAFMYVNDGFGAATIDIECVPDAASLATGYGTFDSGAVDMMNTEI